jgi:hypothetical protein
VSCETICAAAENPHRDSSSGYAAGSELHLQDRLTAVLDS